MAHCAHGEELPEHLIGDINQFLQSNDDDDNGIPPAAPSPPKAFKEPVNVFDFMVGHATPNLPNVNFRQPSSPTPPPEDSDELIKYDFAANGFVDSHGIDNGNGHGPLAQHSCDLPAPEFKTPAPADQQRSKDKKRKRLHIDINSFLSEPHADHDMTDAPGMLHSGLSSGLNRLTVFPPSPDYSGGDSNEPSPSSQIKKKTAQKEARQHSKHSKHSKQTKTKSEANGLLTMFKSSSAPMKAKKRKTTSPGTKTSKSKAKTKTKTKTKTKKPGRRHHHKRSQKTPTPKLLEFKPGANEDEKNGDEEKKESTAMVVYRPRADLFMSFVSKGPDSTKGCSLNKALRRFHRERAESANCLPKPLEEKELFKVLRLKRNDRGEIVLFSIPEELENII